MKIFSRYPVLRFALPFSIGILIAIHSKILFSTGVFLAFGGFIMSVLFTVKNYASGKYAQRWLGGIPFYCCFIGLGATLTWFHQSINYRDHFSKIATSGIFVAEITSEPAATAKGFRFLVSVKACYNENIWKPVRGNLLVYLRDTAAVFSVKPDQHLVFSAAITRIEKNSNPNSFNASAFYAGKGAWHQVYLDQPVFFLPESSESKTVFTYARWLRDNMLLRLTVNLPKNELGVAGALLLGYEEWLNPELESYWSEAGVLHVLCVSGMHVMLIYVILAGLLSWMDKKFWLRNVRYLLLLGLIWFYAMVTGFSPSVIRAAAMISFVIIGNWIDREASIYNLLCSSCVLMFMLNPYLITSAGFQLSFLAVCGIIFLHKLIFPLWTAPNIVLHKIWELLSVSLAAQLSTFPLSIFLFHQFPNYFLIGNLVIIPLSTIVMYSGLLLLVTDWIPYAGLVTGTLTSYGIKILNHVVIAIGQLPGALTENIYFTWNDTLLLYLLLIFIPLWLVLKSRMWMFIIQVLVIAFLTGRIVTLLNAHRKVHVTVYDSHGKSMISHIGGRRGVLVTDLSEPGKSKFIIGPHFISQLVETCDTIQPSKEFLVEITATGTGTIFILKNTGKYHRIPETCLLKRVELLIIGGFFSDNLVKSIAALRPSKVIFDSSCKKFQVQKLEPELKNLGIPTYDVAKQGAYQQVSNLVLTNFR